MTLQKDDLQAIGELVSALIEKQVRPLVKEEVRSALADQNKLIERNFADLKEVMQETYVRRDEFDEKYNDLQNEVDDLRKEVNTLKQRLAQA
jgi:hypothetical protein